MSVCAILQARVSSNRLPGKVLLPIVGKPMLQLELERVARAKRIDRIVVATSTDASDDEIQCLCDGIGIPCFRGSLDDVLDRFYRAALEAKPDYVLRLTGDCPLMDPEMIDEIIDYCLVGGYDYVCNTVKPTFPDGLDAWVCRFGALEKTWQEAKMPSEREHVVTYIKSNPDRFKIGSFEGSADLSRLRWTVDEKEDLELVSRIYEALYPQNPAFKTSDVLALLEEYPELKTLNTHYERDEGLKKSLMADGKKAGRYVRNISQSLALQDHARRRIPGMTQLLSKRADQFGYGVWPAYYSRAKGTDVWDLDGNRYTDMSIAGIGANVLGYADDEVDAAVEAAIAAGSSSSLNCPEEVELADLLCDLHPWADKVRFARTGGESLTIAVRIARAQTKRDKIAFCGYHGWHDWYLSANLGMENGLEGHLLPGLSPVGVPRGLRGTALPFRYNRIEELARIVEENQGKLAAVVMEPIRNEQPESSFLEEVRQLADQAGAVLVFDEVSAGFRLTCGGSHLTLGIQPDIAVFSKALGNGYPCAAVIGKASIMDAAQETFISSTNWTERIGPVAAIATVKKHRRLNVAAHLMEMGRLVQDGWKDVAKANGLDIEVGGIPPLSHFTVAHDEPGVFKALFVQLMQDQGFLASTIYYAMHTHRRWQIEAYIEAVGDAFEEISKLTAKGKAKEALRGQPAKSGFARLN